MYELLGDTVPSLTALLSIFYVLGTERTEKIGTTTRPLGSWESHRHEKKMQLIYMKGIEAENLLCFGECKRETSEKPLRTRS